MVQSSVRPVGKGRCGVGGADWSRAIVDDGGRGDGGACRRSRHTRRQARAAPPSSRSRHSGNPVAQGHRPPRYGPIRTRSAPVPRFRRSSTARAARVLVSKAARMTGSAWSPAPAFGAPQQQDVGQPVAQGLPAQVLDPRVLARRAAGRRVRLAVIRYSQMTRESNSLRPSSVIRAGILPSGIVGRMSGFGGAAKTATERIRSTRRSGRIPPARC